DGGVGSECGGTEGGGRHRNLWPGRAGSGKPISRPLPPPKRKLAVRVRLRLAAGTRRRAGGGTVIRLRLGPGDLERLRFAYSPLAAAAESLYMLHSGQLPSPH